MAQTSQATPTVQANIAGTTSTVNLRDWLNTRLGPFLKKAIIESLDSEAQYPLQWLGEQLILQSIEFEGNPDATDIRERFVYKHEISSRAAQPDPSTAVAPIADVATGQQHQVTATQNAVSSTGTVEPEPAPVATDPSQVARAEVEQTAPAQPEVSTAVNGTTSHSAAETQPQDTEMSNAS